jgi:2-dehydropantoate 2-reductase
MKFLVLGAGSVGGYFGGRLAASGADVTFLVRERRREQLQRDGLIIESALGNLTMPVKTVTAKEIMPGYDLVILTCKAYDLEASMDAIAPVMDGKCALLPLLNGMEHLEQLDARFGHDNILGGSCHIAAMLKSDGVIKHLNDLHRITFGERDKSVTPRIQAIEDAFTKSGVEPKLSSDIMLEMWEKIAFLSTLAGMTCLMRANVGEIVRTPDGAELMQRYFLACVQIATKCGHPPRAHVVQRMSGVVTERDSGLTASMLRDLEGGGQVEADHIVGYMLRKARELYIDDNLLAVAYTHLKAYEERRAAKRLS